MSLLSPQPQGFTRHIGKLLLGTGALQVIYLLSTLTLFTVTATAATNSKHGALVYMQHCARCHDSGENGAPGLQQAELWTARIQQSQEILVQHVMQGFKTMPAKGGNPSLTHVEAKAALDYMLARILGVGDIVMGQQNKALIPLRDGLKLTSGTPINEQVKQSSQHTPKKAAEKNTENAAQNAKSEGLNQAVTPPQPQSAPSNAPPGHSGEKQDLAQAETADVSQTSPPDRELSPSRVLNEILRNGQEYHQSPPLEALPKDKYGDDVRLGHKIFTKTHEYASRYAGNDLSCSQCHLDAGRRPNAAPMWAAFGMYPAYKRRNDRNNSLEDRIQQCFRFSLNGFAPNLDSPEVRSLVAYIHFLSRGAPIGMQMPGRGFPQVVNTGKDPNPSRGAEVYKSRCASCHGNDGAGVQNNDGGFTYPPLWGRHSYNKGAGFSKTALLAGFIKANMPRGSEWSLSDQEALDVAAFINLQVRPWDPRKGMIKGLFE